MYLVFYGSRTINSHRLDYCNSLHMCLSQAALSRLQLVHNAAARLLTRTSHRSNVSPVLASLHWLPIKTRINYKILQITYMALSDLAPSYFSDSQFHSNLSLLSILRSNCKTKRQPRLRSFQPKPSADSLDYFKRLVRTHLYRQVFFIDLHPSYV